jgi:DNA-binding transcriptional LysR family regulator
VLKEFREAFPLVTLRITVEFFQATRTALLEGTADLVLMAASTPLPAEIERLQCGEVELVAVAAANHPLAKIKGSFAAELLRDHLQLVLSSRTEVLDRRDYGVHAVRHWRIADMNLRHKLLLAGIGWCSMPRQLVAADLAAGRLVELKPSRWEGSDRMPRFPLVIAHRRDKALGPAARWLVQRIAAGALKAPRSKPRRRKAR